MTESKFARSAGVSVRTVSNWARCPAMVPRSDAQDMLDDLLAAATPPVLARFGQLTAPQPADQAAGAVPAEPGASVVSLGTHPRYAADFRALACGQVQAARTALGLPPAEFAAWLGTVLGWTSAPGAVEQWEHGATPPGDVVMAAQACLAGAR
jgi:DNA-binding transcriptional regulator YiaG